jgi:uncharacterized protein (DUF58 family)
MSPSPATAPPSANVRPVDDPEIFLAIEDLDLAGRGLADAMRHGQHQSQRRGPGVEFHSHRAYQSGDDLRRVNWALYARHRRLFTRESRAESHRPVYLMLDASASMSIHHGRWSKLHYAMRVLAGAAHLARRQGDAPALCILTDSGTGRILPPRSSADHVSGICAAMAGTPPAGAVDMAAALRRSRDFCQRRGFILCLSDFLEREDETLTELTAFRAQGHDVFALQILDPMEIELPRTGDYDFIDQESGRRLRAAAEPLHAAYARRVLDWRTGLRRQAENAGLRWHSVSTVDSLAATLQHWLL